MPLRLQQQPQQQQQQQQTHVHQNRDVPEPQQMYSQHHQPSDHHQFQLPDQDHPLKQNCSPNQHHPRQNHLQQKHYPPSSQHHHHHHKQQPQTPRKNSNQIARTLVKRQKDDDDDRYLAQSYADYTDAFHTQDGDDDDDSYRVERTRKTNNAVDVQACNVSDEQQQHPPDDLLENVSTYMPKKTSSKHLKTQISTSTMMAETNATNTAPNLSSVSPLEINELKSSPTSSGRTLQKNYKNPKFIDLKVIDSSVIHGKNKNINSSFNNSSWNLSDSVSKNSQHVLQKFSRMVRRLSVNREHFDRNDGDEETCCEQQIDRKSSNIHNNAACKKNQRRNEDILLTNNENVTKDKTKTFLNLDFSSLTRTLSNFALSNEHLQPSSQNDLPATVQTQITPPPQQQNHQQHFQQQRRSPPQNQTSPIQLQHRQHAAKNEARSSRSPGSTSGHRTPPTTQVTCSSTTTIHQSNLTTTNNNLNVDASPNNSNILDTLMPRLTTDVSKPLILPQNLVPQSLADHDDENSTVHFSHFSSNVFQCETKKNVYFPMSEFHLNMFRFLDSQLEMKKDDLNKISNCVSSQLQKNENLQLQQPQQQLQHQHANPRIVKQYKMLLNKIKMRNRSLDIDPDTSLTSTVQTLPANVSTKTNVADTTNIAIATSSSNFNKQQNSIQQSFSVASSTLPSNKNYAATLLNSHTTPQAAINRQQLLRQTFPTTTSTSTTTKSAAASTITSTNKLNSYFSFSYPDASLIYNRITGLPNQILNTSWRGMLVPLQTKHCSRMKVTN
ncbi:hypothetical protein HELRODRAFT_160552 [Helobdella robusta]|uniref:Uncharacterized protein n=1 Tax=Helobdella robusta TaxID=6412 RepID=T1EQE7_HELRO|nr:hypothetical protein HELRODRAFT_160552 [Helobdella robusta]ESO06384.1 hypothetical protein HELRODRAFT_160552 [Helobdella robusta]